MQVQSVACTAVEDEGCNKCDDLLALASALEQRSEHPLAQAVVEEAANLGLQHQISSSETGLGPGWTRCEWVGKRPSGDHRQP